MANGIRLDVTVDDERVKKAFEAYAARGRSFEYAFKVIGEMLRTSTRHHFEVEADPWGRKWQPLSERTKWSMTRKGGKTTRGFMTILRATGRMYQSIISHASPWSVEVGTNARAEDGISYPMAMQQGVPSQNIPARPFLGLNDEDVEEVGAILMRLLEKPFDPGFIPSPWK
jgi:phage virion morphogenesis protein